MALKKKPISEEEARLKMADLCARSEQCAWDIRQKLYRMGIFSDARDRIISFLEENRFIDEERFARSYSRDKVRFSSWGPFKVRQGLYAKRISSDAIDEGLSAVEDEEWESALGRACGVKSRQLDLIGEDARNNRMKLYRFLLTRGFGSPEVKEAVIEAVKRQKKETDK